MFSCLQGKPLSAASVKSDAGVHTHHTLCFLSCVCSDTWSMDRIVISVIMATAGLLSSLVQLCYSCPNINLVHCTFSHRPPRVSARTPYPLHAAARRSAAASLEAVPSTYSFPVAPLPASPAGTRCPDNGDPDHEERLLRHCVIVRPLLLSSD